MAVSTKTTSILLSIVIAAGLMGVAFYFSGARPNVADAVSTEELLRAYAEKDSDSDLLPDWQEALYGSDPLNPRSIDSSMTDGEAVAAGRATVSLREEVSPELPDIPGVEVEADTVTGAFGRKLFTDYFEARGQNQPTSDDIIAFVTSAADTLAIENDTRARYSSKDLTIVQDNSQEALKAYAARVASSVVRPSIDAPQNELFYFYDYVALKDEAALPKVAALGKSYKETAAAYMRIPVPAIAAAPHLELVNALYRTGEATEYMAAVKTDPLLAFLGIAQYQTASAALHEALKKSVAVFVATFPAQTP